MLFYTAFVAIFAVTNGMLVEPRQQLDKQNPSDVLNDSPLCDVCELVVQTAVDLLHDGDTEAEIENLVKRGCNILPGNVETVCNSLVDQYGPQIIEMLADSVDPQNICSLLKVCSSQAVSNGMLVQPPQEVEKQNSKDVELDASPLCGVCELVVKEAVNLIKDGDTEAEIEKVVKKVCDKLPGSVKEKCNTIVDKYADKIIQLLVNSVDPSTVCTLLTLC